MYFNKLKMSSNHHLTAGTLPSLPSYVPNIPDHPWNEIVLDRMYYYLTSDESTWNAYAEAASDTVNYDVNVVDLVASIKFSPFII